MSAVPSPYLSKASLARALEISESTVDELVRRGVLPRPARLSSGCVRWRWEMVDYALASMIPGSNAAAQDDADAGVELVIQAAKERRRGRTA
jgi:predicted DNA-binding transcriptional regulator AlpA